MSSSISPVSASLLESSQYPRLVSPSPAIPAPFQEAVTSFMKPLSSSWVHQRCQSHTSSSGCPSLLGSPLSSPEIPSISPLSPHAVVQILGSLLAQVFDSALSPDTSRQPRSPQVFSIVPRAARDVIRDYHIPDHPVFSSPSDSRSLLIEQRVSPPGSSFISFGSFDPVPVVPCFRAGARSFVKSKF